MPTTILRTRRSAPTAVASVDGPTDTYTSPTVTNETVDAVPPREEDAILSRHAIMPIPNPAQAPIRTCLGWADDAEWAANTIDNDPGPVGGPWADAADYVATEAEMDAKVYQLESLAYRRNVTPHRWRGLVASHDIADDDESYDAVVDALMDRLENDREYDASHEEAQS